MIEKHPSRDPQKEAGMLLGKVLKDAKEKDVLFLSSGGSALTLLEHVAPGVLGPHITISVLDERFSDNPTVNNFAQLTNTSFYTRAQEKGCSFIDTRPQEGETLRKFANRLEIGIRSWRALHKKGTIIVTQGVSTDGHTAGIMPFPDNLVLFTALFESRDKWMVGYSMPHERNKFRQRVTVTLPFLRNEVDVAIGFAVSEEKREVIRNLFARNKKTSELPACVMHEMKYVHFVSDVL